MRCVSSPVECAAAFKTDLMLRREAVQAALAAHAAFEPYMHEERSCMRPHILAAVEAVELMLGMAVTELEEDLCIDAERTLHHLGPCLAGSEAWLGGGGASPCPIERRASD